ncbi:MAG: hypothetical protein ACTSRZ_12975 [Promethearchaeota archaeon]
MTGQIQINENVINKFYNSFSEKYKERIDDCIEKIVRIKQENGKIAVVTGSGPNIHEGVTTLIAELINKEIIDGILTSSAVIAHEMAGSLDKVKRVKVIPDSEIYNILNDKKNKDREVWLPKGDIFELTMLEDSELKEVADELGDVDFKLVNKLKEANGTIIIKAAGNMAYPMGLRTERLAEQILEICINDLKKKYPFEYIAGLGADPKTMIGAAARKNVPVLVTIPQMVGGGAVGLCVGDSISIHDRCLNNAKILGNADIIIESGLALAQEIHDGPYETYTGHGIWAQWDKHYVYSLKNKILIRFDLDTNLEKVWLQERNSKLVQEAINEGKPKTKITGIPFRMEMSGFARLETSIPIVGDLGEIWPVIALNVAKDLGIKLDFISYKQETPEGQKMRDWIVENVKYINIPKMLSNLKNL